METPDALLAQLKAERQATKDIKVQLGNLDRQIAERTSYLERAKTIEPNAYQDLLARHQQLKDEELKQNQDWDGLKDNYDSQKRELIAKAKELQSRYERVLTQQAIKDAFVAAGGIAQVKDGDISPLDLVTQYLFDRVQVKDDRITLLDRSGNPESMSLVEKMLQIKKGSRGSLFQSDSKKSTPSQSRPVTSQPLVYTQEQARSGKADLKKIARGQAIVR